MKAHHKGILVGVGVLAIGILGYELYKRKGMSAANAAPTGSSVQNALTSPIPVYTVAVGTSLNAGSGHVAGRNIGNSKPNDTPVGGVIPESIVAGSTALAA